MPLPAVRSTSVNGAGTLRINSFTLPLGLSATSDFVVDANGGTIEYYDVAGNLPTLTKYCVTSYYLIPAVTVYTLTNPSSPTTYTI